MHHARYDPAQELHRIYENSDPVCRSRIRLDFSALSQLTHYVEYETVMRQMAEHAGSKSVCQVAMSPSSAE